VLDVWSHHLPGSFEHVLILGYLTVRISATDWH